MRDYHINIFYSLEDGGYVADIPDLVACSAFGQTPTEALEQLQIAKLAWLEAARAAGKPIPRPRYRPVIYQSPGYGRLAPVLHG
ncbi:MAG: type II toxin-antitoxin system HicB family antitoxin [Chloroflexi bacterium HGW-Chloroflexi-1]|nr:MAG: type II toxin-antitoxin system HicB family antitoxin [Chloroflexi bacterium HGW-Chloroflexi-1]